MRLFLIITLALGFTSSSSVASAQQINIRKYTIEEGLVNNDVLNIYQDSRGFIWLCTRGGLSRYDGSRFTNFTTTNGLTNDMINDIVEIAPQEFIVAQNSNGPRLLKNDRLLPFKNDDFTLNKFYTTAGGNLLAANDNNGVAVWDKSKFVPLNINFKTGADRMVMVNDSVWLLMTVANVAYLTNASLQLLSQPALISPTSVCTDSYHRTWIGTASGLKLLDNRIQPGKPISFLPLPAAFNLPLLKQSYISAFIQDSRGNCWIGTNKGLVKVDDKGQSNIYARQQGLSFFLINCIMEDRQQNIWVGTQQGLMKFSLNTEISNFEPDSDFSYYGSWIVLPVTETTVRIFDGKNISNLDIETGTLINKSQLGDTNYAAYKISNDEVLFAKNKNATIYQYGEEPATTISWPAQRFEGVIRAGKNHFIGISGNTVFSIVNGRCTKKISITNDLIRSIAFEKNNFLWAGAFGTGLFKIAFSNENDSLPWKIVDTFFNRLPDAHIRSLYTDRQNELWVGTRYKGLLRLTGQPGDKYKIQQYGTDQGMVSNYITAINRDKVGNIWAGSVQGLDKLIPNGNSYRVFNFGKVNKIYSVITDVHFFSNSYLVTTGNPVITYTRDVLQDTLPPPQVYINKVTAGTADTSLISYSGPVQLPYNKAQISFEFSAPQFINEDFTQYSYRLLGGNNTNWSIADKSHSVYFANLRPGKYSFEVRVLGFNGNWGEPARYDFIINTPYWQKPWFLSVVAAAIGLLIYALYRYRMKQLMNVQKVRNRIATDLHDEIGSTLTNINILSNLSKSNLSNTSKAEDFLQRISEEVSSSSQALDDIIWSVNTNHDTLEETVARMRRYAAELFDAAGISYELYLDHTFEKTKLAMEQRRDIYLLYKEAVNNISKHAQAKQVSIKIDIEHSQLRMHIADDGEGFEPGKENHRHGLQGMKQRVEKWKGKITIESGNSKGTSIQIRLPV